MADITPPSSQQNTPQPSIGKTLPDPDPAAMDVDLDEESESIASEGSAKILVPSGAERAEQVGQAAEADADESEDEGDEEIEVEDEAEAEVEAEEEKGKPEKKGKAPLGGPKRPKRPFKGQLSSTHSHPHATRSRQRTDGPHKTDGSLFDSEIVARWNTDFGDVLSPPSSNARAAPVPTQAAQS
ncbi:hypothetical protein I315_01735 [Cryptococcus gattii Ru294]|uniref:Uncharacterized protein n=2 Tax=Cryptococcus gattii TaxID=37769 RepID=E6R002_CRYGW|nr:Hypothetical protein CGB_B1320W [Cryptococcus gattii WM276]KIR55853.1 hypothetical protein I315_01735 [Cryptococcus gattii Ru294]KIR77347.1 hypothetical protein I306_05658 [Cryptococcus gattii EJB2]KIY36370.1 hypothetical protein I305_01231 [Cryptococcus gattii E566]KJE05980.1 hypothetical protein I311_00116 [Cryptococcus gattii NT-10]ADV20147.1 Hypothetical protein CGB_B1320W [Cryptococcus gattii WM276]